MNRGFLKLYRKIADNPLWNKKPFSDGQAWVDLLLIANHKPGIIDKRGIRIKIKRGQVGYSVLGLSDRWGWSRSKVVRFLKHLETEQQIEQQKSTVTTLITLINYESYNQDEQQKEQQTSSRRTADEQQTNTNKNEKNGNNEKKKICSEFKNVSLSDDEYQKLTERFGEIERDNLIERLGGYISSSGKKYKSHYATIVNWARKDNLQQKPHLKIATPIGGFKADDI